MKENSQYEAIIIGGSYAGLSAAMALGRASRKVLVIDGGKPCNRQTPHSHNFITQDGRKPAEIAHDAKLQVLKYDTVSFYEGLATTGKKVTDGFELETQSGGKFKAKKLIFASGLKDIMPNIKGFAECWGISVIHCPYCHGYEVKSEKTAILANGEVAFHYAQLIFNWTRKLSIFTNGKSTLTQDQTAQIAKNGIEIIETSVDYIDHTEGYVRQVVFNDGSAIAVNAIYSRPDFVQQSDIPEKLGCKLNDKGLIEVDMTHQTSVDGVYACGDNSGMRAVSQAVATGTMAGASLNNTLVVEEF